MKKLLLMIIFLSVSLCSCRGNPSVDTVAHRLLALYDIPPSTTYVKYETEGEYGFISPEDFIGLYTGEKEKLPEWELIVDFQIVLSNSTEPFELHVLLVYS
jgi:hypothetical protein